ncbi:LPS export ABC transporter periplasmic protein LptC [Rhodoferax sp. PAMC 29310]|uniref:LPS export ABC transporter periplasmic protein LptC n=1 Tax=Rhodoferax sp. PAMC 29310 TaxID=2822760 RepID=UPI001F0A4715|nr:LPS export ABC transporter periplasmic protein LptC [Rhodoferax sp. PAMC 29310]
MGVFALGTYWLVRSTPLLIPPEPVVAARHDPDYFMRNFSVKTYGETGRLKSEVTGSNARHFPDSDTLEIDGVRIRSFDEENRLTTVSARRALTNSDNSEVQLFGDALVIRLPGQDAKGNNLPGMEFRGEFLHAFMDTEQIKSHLPVVLIRGLDRFNADTLDFDNRTGVLLLNGRVKGVLVPTKSP